MGIVRALGRLVGAIAGLYRMQLHLLVSWQEGRRALLGRLFLSFVAATTDGAAVGASAADPVPAAAEGTTAL